MIASKDFHEERYAGQHSAHDHKRAVRLWNHGVSMSDIARYQRTSRATIELMLINARRHDRRNVVSTRSRRAIQKKYDIREHATHEDSCNVVLLWNQSMTVQQISELTGLKVPEIADHVVAAENAHTDLSSQQIAERNDELVTRWNATREVDPLIADFGLSKYEVMSILCQRARSGEYVAEIELEDEERGQCADAEHLWASGHGLEEIAQRTGEPVMEIADHVAGVRKDHANVELLKAWTPSWRKRIVAMWNERTCIHEMSMRSGYTPRQITNMVVRERNRGRKIATRGQIEHEHHH